MTQDHVGKATEATWATEGSFAPNPRPMRSLMGLLGQEGDVGMRGWNEGWPEVGAGVGGVLGGRSCG